MATLNKQNQKVYRNQSNADLIRTGECAASESNPVPTWQQVVGFIFGFTFVTAVLVITVVFKDLSHQQYALVKIVLALAAAGCAGVFMGFLAVEGKFAKMAVRAGGALAVFVIVFFFTPTPAEEHSSRPNAEETADVIQVEQTQQGAGGIQIGVSEGPIIIGRSEEASKK